MWKDRSGQNIEAGKRRKTKITFYQYQRCRVGPKLDIYVSGDQCDQIKSPNVYKSCPKVISLEKEWLWHLHKNCLTMWVDLGKIIVATGFEWLPKMQKIAQSGHTAGDA